eukprot:gene42841-52346_t
MSSSTEKRTSRRKKGGVLRLFFYSAVFVPLLAAAALRVLDYNRFIQIPYWTLFSICYLFPEAELSVCQVSSIDAVLDWTFRQWDWSLEKHQPGTTRHIPVIEAKDFSYELLEKLTEGFTVPV